MTVVSSTTFDLPLGAHRVSLENPSGIAGAVCTLSILGNAGSAEFSGVDNGQCHVLRYDNEIVDISVQTPTELLVSVTGETRESIAQIAVKVEKLSTDVPAGVLPAFGARDSANLRVLAHIERRGDVVFGNGEWIGHLASPRRIEGIAVQWTDCPADVSLQYQVKTANNNASGWKNCGEFAGSKGRAMPITGLEMRLVGGEGLGLAVQVEGEFITAQSTTLRVRSKAVSAGVRGPTGTESLVGLQLSIVSAAVSPPADAVSRMSSGGGYHQPAAESVPKSSPLGAPAAVETRSVDAAPKPRVRVLKPSGAV